MSDLAIQCDDRTRLFPPVWPDGDRLRFVYNAVNDGIFITEAATGQLIDVNEPGCRMFGYDKSELIGRSIGPLSSGVYPYTQDSAVAHMGNPHLRAAKTFEWHCKTKDGELFWSEISIRCTRLDHAPVVVAIVRDITKRKRLAAEIAHMDEHDALTGLANRGMFTTALNRAIPNAQDTDKSVAILFLDVDHFKDINDIRGHLIGDQLMRLVGERLQDSVRFNETLFSLGGDDFAILIGDAGKPSDIGAVAERLIAAVSRPYSIDGSEVQVGASIGIAIAGEGAGDPDTLMSHATAALYRAKAEGRHTHRFYSAAMEHEARSRIALTNKLRIAIPDGQLFVVYQPQVKTMDGRIVGVEALVRWAHPSGVLCPDCFLPVAESSGLIVALDRWVLREACRQGRQWIDAGVAPVTMCVNVSSAQFKQPLELERFVLAVLDETGLPANMLELEITESTLIGFSSEHRNMMRRLRSSGVKLALDDFGTGYSSLNYLRLFAVDRIKIAREFIADLASSSDAGAIVRCILNLARDLGNEVTAEGVETPEQLKLLQEWDCPDIQGFYFAAPMSAEVISPLLRAGAISPGAISPCRPN